MDPKNSVVALWWVGKSGRTAMVGLRFEIARYLAEGFIDEKGSNY